MEKTNYKSRTVRMPENVIEILKKIKLNDKRGLSFNSVTVECIIKGIEELHKIKV